MFTLKIKTQNDAFGETADSAAAEVAAILRKVADQLDYESPLVRGVYDANGNKVGAYALEPLDEEN